MTSGILGRMVLPLFLVFFLLLFVLVTLFLCEKTTILSSAREVNFTNFFLLVP